MKNKKKGKNLEDIQQMNRSLVVRLLRRMQICSRADLAKETGLKQATITNIINDLISWGLVKETGIINGKKGRRSIGITLDNENFKIIGARLTRNYFSVGLFDLFGINYGVRTEKINIKNGSEAALEKMEKNIDSLFEETKIDRIIGIGLATPGPFFRDEGRIALMTEFPGWEHIFLKEELESSFGVPIYLEHDANAGALAEWWFGHVKKDTGTLIYIAAGQGIGAGIVIDGLLYRGSLGIAGEIGHMSINYKGNKCACGSRGCLEQYCSTIALQKEIERKLKKNYSLESIFAAIKNGDDYVIPIFEKAVKFLALGIVNIINIFNPDTIIIGDELVNAGPKLLEILKLEVKKNVLPDIYKKLTINLSEFKKDPVLIGASALAADKILHKPSLLKDYL